MAFTKTQIGIAVGAGVLLVLVFVGYLWWLSNQGPVLARSEDHDPLTGLPVSIRMNPLRTGQPKRRPTNFFASCGMDIATSCSMLGSTIITRNTPNTSAVLRRSIH